MIDDESFTKYLRFHVRECRARYNEFLLEHQAEAIWTSDIGFVRQIASLALDDVAASQEVKASIRAMGASELAGRAALYASMWLYLQLLRQLNEVDFLDKVISAWEETSDK